MHYPRNVLGLPEATEECHVEDQSELPYSIRTPTAQKQNTSFRPLSRAVESESVKLYRIRLRTRYKILNRY
jgi:hypothetical protein